MSLQKSLPWTQSPLIINAPMAGFAKADLAIAVTKAGGLGQIGGNADLEDLDAQLSMVESTLDRINGLLPIGVGLLSFAMKKDAALALVQKYKPAVVWLFASHELSDYAEWADGARKASPQSQIWVQNSGVESALEIAKNTRPDVLVIQGIDAGGHGWEAGAGIISLLPEISDALQAAGHATHLVAAGGIADGRGAAAAFALGVEGVVLGTRFLSATETNIPADHRAAVLATRDGGQNTVRDKVFDELRGPNQWPTLYDGRSLRTTSFRDHSAGVGIDEIRKRHASAVKAKDTSYGSQWAGTGVGLVREEQAAATIVEEVRSGALASLNAAKARL
ncbi:putative nitronate monooxygenase, aldolase-type TIM barrel [Septoria linicola]|nr:putative nitronate monooxygenase, aldolase-type TIM barrel [Septoria linicola]